MLNVGRATLALALVFTVASLAVAQDFDIAAPEDLRAQTNESVVFRGWQFMTHIVEDNVNRYNVEMDGNVDYATVTGEYASIMETQLLSRAPLDVLYANPSQAARYYDGGWLIPINEFPNYEELAGAMYDNVREAWTYKGNLLGLSYFVTTRGVVHVNLDLYTEAGLSEEDFPTTWDELYDQLYVLRDAGISEPYLAHFFGEWFGISWGFLFETHNRGGIVADPETHEPLLSVDGPAGDTLRAWKRIWNDGLVPQEVLTYSEADYLEAWGSGRYVLSPQQAYDLKRFNDPQYSNMAGSVTFLPYQGQSWGLIDSAMYLTTSRPRSDAHTEDVMRFTSWYGFKDHEGEVFVGNRWMDEAMLFSAYREVMESEATRQVIQEALIRDEDYGRLVELYQNTPYPRGVWNVVWAPEFDAWLRELLQEFLLQDRPVEETIQQIIDQIEGLNARYGVN